MKVQKAKHSSENKLYYIKFIMLILVIVLVISLIAWYIGQSKFYFRNTELRVQHPSYEFHFYSSILSTQNKEYNLYDWDVDEDYRINIDLENFIDSYRATNDNILYTVTASTLNSDKINVLVDPENVVLEEVEGEPQKNGVLQTSEKSESFDISINKLAGAVIEDSEFVTVNVVVNSTSPYTKTLTATFNIYKKNTEQYILKYKEDADRKLGNLVIETRDLTEPVEFNFNSEKLILNTTSQYLQDATINTVDGVTNVSVELESNKIYNFNFIKIDDTEATVWK